LGKNDFTIARAKDGYTFTPVFVKVTVLADHLIFTAHKIQANTFKIQGVFDWFTKVYLGNGILESAENSNMFSLYHQALAAMVFIAKVVFTSAA
jgi:hypothetical protein